MGMNVGHVNRGVALVRPDPTPDPHPQALLGVLLDVDSPLGQLGSMLLKSFFLCNIQVG